PLPPGWLAWPRPMTVSAGRGCLRTLTTRSMFRLPTTATRPRLSAVGWGTRAPSRAAGRPETGAPSRPVARYPPGTPLRTSALPVIGVAPDDEAGGVARGLVGHVALDDAQRLDRK